jgi:hypothetical protein
MPLFNVPLEIFRLFPTMHIHFRVLSVWLAVGAGLHAARGVKTLASWQHHLATVHKMPTYFRDVSRGGSGPVDKKYVTSACGENAGRLSAVGCKRGAAGIFSILEETADGRCQSEVLRTCFSFAVHTVVPPRKLTTDHTQWYLRRINGAALTLGFRICLCVSTPSVHSAGEELWQKELDMLGLRAFLGDETITMQSLAEDVDEQANSLRTDAMRKNTRAGGGALVREGVASEATLARDSTGRTQGSQYRMIVEVVSEREEAILERQKRPRTKLSRTEHDREVRAKVRHDHVEGAPYNLHPAL